MVVYGAAIVGLIVVCVVIAQFMRRYGFLPGQQRCSKCGKVVSIHDDEKFFRTGRRVCMTLWYSGLCEKCDWEEHRGKHGHVQDDVALPEYSE